MTAFYDIGNFVFLFLNPGAFELFWSHKLCRKNSKYTHHGYQDLFCVDARRVTNHEIENNRTLHVNQWPNHVREETSHFNVENRHFINFSANLCYSPGMTLYRLVVHLKDSISPFDLEDTERRRYVRTDSLSLMHLRYIFMTAVVTARWGQRQNCRPKLSLTWLLSRSLVEGIHIQMSSQNCPTWLVLVWQTCNMELFYMLYIYFCVWNTVRKWRD